MVFVVLCKAPRAVIAATLIGLTVQPGFFSAVFFFFLKSIKQQQVILRNSQRSDPSAGTFATCEFVGFSLQTSSEAVLKRDERLIWTGRVCVRHFQQLQKERLCSLRHKQPANV